MENNAYKKQWYQPPVNQIKKYFDTVESTLKENFINCTKDLHNKKYISKTEISK